MYRVPGIYIHIYRKTGRQPVQFGVWGSGTDIRGRGGGGEGGTNRTCIDTVTRWTYLSPVTPGILSEKQSCLFVVKGVYRACIDDCRASEVGWMF